MAPKRCRSAKGPNPEILIPTLIDPRESIGESMVTLDVAYIAQDMYQIRQSLDRLVDLLSR